jgi:DNA-binding NarL/FixJ family response regulator
MTTLRVLIAEDHAILREGLRALLAQAPDLEVVGEAEDGRGAVRAASELRPDIILMDLSMPHMNGTEAIRAIKRRLPQTKIIALTGHKSEEYVRATLQAGADGYVLKDDTHHDLLSAIRSALKNGAYLSPAISRNVVLGYLKGEAASTGQTSWDRLTHRERGIVKLIAEGYKNREIAEYLSLSPKTVEKHRANLMRKLDLHNASAITAYAMEHGLVTR